MHMQKIHIYSNCGIYSLVSVMELQLFLELHLAKGGIIRYRLEMYCIDYRFSLHNMNYSYYILEEPKNQGLCTCAHTQVAWSISYP